MKTEAEQMRELYEMSAATSGLILHILIFCIISILVFVIINAIISKCFQEIAWEKGFYQKRYFWMPFLFGFIGWIMIWMLPDRGVKHMQSTSEPNNDKWWK